MPRVKHKPPPPEALICFTGPYIPPERLCCPPRTRTSPFVCLEASGPEEGTPILLVPSPLQARGSFDRAGDTSLDQRLRERGCRLHIIVWRDASLSECFSFLDYVAAVHAAVAARPSPPHVVAFCLAVPIAMLAAGVAEAAGASAWAKSFTALSGAPALPDDHFIPGIDALKLFGTQTLVRSDELAAVFRDIYTHPEADGVADADIPTATMAVDTINYAYVFMREKLAYVHGLKLDGVPVKMPTCPQWVIHGKRDPIIPDAAVRGWAQEVPELHVITNDGGHARGILSIDGSLPHVHRRGNCRMEIASEAHWIDTWWNGIHRIENLDGRG
jgi:pimeloyl-ACP methyl ester carboxylesterase